MEAPKTNKIILNTFLQDGSWVKKCLWLHTFFPFVCKKIYLKDFPFSFSHVRVTFHKSRIVMSKKMANFPETCPPRNVEVVFNDTCFAQCNYHGLLRADCTGASCQAERIWLSDN